MSPYKVFKIDKKKLIGLESDEKKILPILVEAAKKIDEVYLLQENDKYEGANLYPHNVSKGQIEKEAESNSKILSPFTVVQKDSNGELVAVNYSEKYADILKQVAHLVDKAAKLSKNRTFKNYLVKLSQALLTDNYQKADIAWLAIKNSNIDVTLGPYERNLDKLFFIKRAFQGHVGIIDKENTRKARFIRDILYTNIGQNPHQISPPSIVDINVEKNIISSGLLGELFFSQQHLPSDADITERYGSRIIGFLSSIDYKFENLIYPIYCAIFEKKFKDGYTKKILKRGNYYHVLLHSIAQQLHRYRDSRARLKELFLIFDEANSEVSGVQHAKHLVLKGVINQKELEAMMIIHICWIFSEWITAKRTKSREGYLKGDTLILNFLIREGALMEKDGISWPNFAKMFFEIENLSSIFVRYLEYGTYIEAQEFLAKYLSYEPFKAFESRLSKIKPI